MMTKDLFRPRPAPVLVLLLLAALTMTGLAAESDLLKPLRTNTPPKIDGILDDPVWTKAPTVTGFETFIPEFGKVQPEQTIVYMVYDRENLYFGFRCFDNQPDKIKAAVSRRDNVQTDDFVCINLDSFNDQQALYALYVNPLGIQADSRFASNREDFSVDVIWYSAGRIDGKGVDSLVLLRAGSGRPVIVTYPVNAIEALPDLLQTALQLVVHRAQVAFESRLGRQAGDETVHRLSKGQ